MASPNIWIIQKDLKKLKIALSTIDKKSPNNFLYTNCISHFNCDNVNMCNKNFDSFLYCQDNDTYLIFMKGHADKVDYAINYLKKNNIQYHEISFKNENEDVVNRFPNSLTDQEVHSKEMWVVNSEESLIHLIEELMKNNKRKNISFYPMLNSNIKLSYSNNNDEEIKINTFLFEGIIVTKDKIVLLTNNNELTNIPVKSILTKLDIKLVTIEFNRPRFVNIAEKRNKKFDGDYNSEKIKLLAKMY